jgi:CheY-like chemotaxis protein
VEAKKMIDQHGAGAVPVLLAEFNQVVIETDARSVAMPVHSISIANILNNVEESISYRGNEQENIRFTAPDARILIVDDIATNLKVAEGLLTPYGMGIDACDNGAEAIRLAEANRYDIIFMDHMMPEMDGIETASAIRALNGNYFKTVPIIALTANAVFGMKEMFLAEGFNDYLSKPIEIFKLNEQIERWIPGDKRRSVGKPVKRTQSEVAAYPPVMEVENLEIEGLDVQRGVMMTGGAMTNYLRVLELFCRDAEVRLEILREMPDEAALPLFTTQAHALKSASASIGAASLSKKAALLEDAAKHGHMAAIPAELDEFRESLISLTGRIRAALPQEKAMEQGGESGSPDKSALLRLKAAVETEDIGLIDQILDGLGHLSEGTEAGKTLSAVAERVLMSEFCEAAALLTDLIGGMGE